MAAIGELDARERAQEAPTKSVLSRVERVSYRLNLISEVRPKRERVTLPEHFFC